jgi:hypothetical protein
MIPMRETIMTVNETEIVIEKAAAEAETGTGTGTGPERGTVTMINELAARILPVIEKRVDIQAQENEGA